MSRRIGVFIAHAGPDKAFARDLYDACQRHGLDPFVDFVDLVAGDQWDRALADAQRRAELTAVLVGPTFDAAYYLREEVATGIALGRAGAHRTVPVLLPGAPAEPPYGLRILHRINWTTADEAARELARALGTPVAVAPPPPPPAPAELSRDQRYDVMIRLLPAQVGEILFRMSAPVHEFPTRTQAEQAISMVQWLDLQQVELRVRFDGLLRQKAPDLVR